MRFFGKKKINLLDDPVLSEMNVILEFIKVKQRTYQANPSKELALEIVRDCSVFEEVYETRIDSNFMLRLNQLDLPTYKFVQGWILEVGDLTKYFLGCYIIAWSKEHPGWKKLDLVNEFNRVTSGIYKSQDTKRQPNLLSSLSWHNIDLNKLI